MSFKYNPISQQMEYSEDAGKDIATDIVFTSVDHDTLSWSSGVIVLGSGEFKTIDAGTVNISGNTYIYYDGSSTLKFSTDLKTAMGGINYVLGTCTDMAVGEKVMYNINGDPGRGVFIDGDQIKAGSITADKIDVTDLFASYILVNGKIVVKNGTNERIEIDGTDGSIRGYNVDNMETFTLSPVDDYMFIGQGTDYLEWDAGNLTVRGNIQATSVSIGAVSSTGVNFNYAGSSSKGGNANDVDYVSGLSADDVAVGAYRGFNALNASYRYTRWLETTSIVETKSKVGYTGVCIDNSGISGYYAGSKKFEITSMGDAYFSGDIGASNIVGSTLTIGNTTDGRIVIDSDDISIRGYLGSADGGTEVLTISPVENYLLFGDVSNLKFLKYTGYDLSIVGAEIRTALTGARVELGSTLGLRVKDYTGVDRVRIPTTYDRINFYNSSGSLRGYLAGGIILGLYDCLYTSESFGIIEDLYIGGATFTFGNIMFWNNGYGIQNSSDDYGMVFQSSYCDVNLGSSGYLYFNGFDDSSEYYLSSSSGNPAWTKGGTTYGLLHSTGSITAGSYSVSGRIPVVIFGTTRYLLYN